MRDGIRMAALAAVVAGLGGCASALDTNLVQMGFTQQPCPREDSQCIVAWGRGNDLVIARHYEKESLDKARQVMGQRGWQPDEDFLTVNGQRGRFLLGGDTKASGVAVAGIRQLLLIEVNQPKGQASMVLLKAALAQFL